VQKVGNSISQHATQLVLLARTRLCALKPWCEQPLLVWITTMWTTIRIRVVHIYSLHFAVVVTVAERA